MYCNPVIPLGKFRLVVLSWDSRIRDSFFIIAVFVT
jgi:hypothetical protein